MNISQTCSPATTTDPGVAITDRYRCPVEFADRFTVQQESGKEFFDFHDGRLRLDIPQNVRNDGGEISLPFDPVRMINTLRYERYMEVPNGIPIKATPGSVVSRLYYLARPLLPVALRRPLQALYFRGWNEIPFPRWPIDVTVESILENILSLCLKAQGLDAVPFIWFWPDGAAGAALMTHDVETASGQNYCPRLMDLDESFDIRSAFQIVPEERYRVTPSFLDELRSRGHEINIQDLNHDGRLFHSLESFESRVERINQYGRAYGARGFRSAVLYRNVNWYDRLEFDYDMSIPNVGHLEAQRGGCCTVFPYFVGNILELPVTTTQDYSLFYILRDYSLDLWKTQVNAILSKHGVASFIVHPDYIQTPREQSLYCTLLDFLNRCRADHGVWITTPGELNDWWRQRSESTLVYKGGAWEIEGPAKDRARIAYARIEDGTIVYSQP